MNYLFIAEKGSLMTDVRNCYNNHKSEIINKVGSMDFIALSGHVCTNYEPTDYPDWGDRQWGEIDYPMIPDVWLIKPIDDAGKKKVLAQIKSNIHNYDGVIVGTDSDVEGYGIYYLLEQYLGIGNMPALRFMEHSLTDEEILVSLLSMTDFHTDITHKQFVQSFLLRSRADWLFGMNGTRAATVQVGEMMAIGRVKAPTIKIVYDNSMAIDNFKPETFYTLESTYTSGDSNFTAVFTEDGTNPVRFASVNQMPDVPMDGVVKTKDTKRTYTGAPQLYDLSAIQSEAGGKFGYSPAKTLEIIQSLYEKHKLISYPRTQCRYVSVEKAKEFPRMLAQMDAFKDLAPYAAKITQDDIQRVYKNQKVVNDKEVQKESHDALLPTSNKPDLSKLSVEEQNICRMIYTRLLAQFLPPLEEDKTTIVVSHGGEYDFIAKGKIVVNIGWRALYNKPSDNVIPDIAPGDSITANEIKPVERQTTPPKRLTQATLLNAMQQIASQINDPVLKKSLADSKGIGTPATRAGIILDILNRGYIEEKKGKLYITNAGKRYIDAIKDLEIVSPVFAAKLDTKIKEVQRGESNYDEVYNDILFNLSNMIRQIEGLEKKTPTLNIGCPHCGAKFQHNKYNYFCPSCGFKVGKEICKVPITEQILEEVCTEGITQRIFTFTKKDGDAFKARLKLGQEAIEFEFSSGIECPFCNNPVKLNRGGAFCDCGLKVFRKMGSKEFSDQELTQLLKNGRLNKVSGFVSKAGKPYTPDIILTENGAKMDTSSWGNN